MLLHGLRDGKLGTDTVDGSDQDGTTSITGLLQVDFTAKASDFSVSSGASSRCYSLTIKSAEILRTT
jgi:hypothetical protein